MPYIIFNRLLPVALVVVVTGASQASGWTCTVLDSAFRHSSGFAVGEGRVYGYLQERATRWDLATGTTTDYHPSGAITFSDIRGAGGGKLVGYFHEGNQVHAIVWDELTGTGSDLNPIGYTNSHAYATDGFQQVGDASTSGVTHAALWTGSGESFINLNPAGSTYSAALGCAQGIQVGGAFGKAGYWTGSAASWQPISTISSIATGIFGDQIVGHTFAAGLGSATLWSLSGSPEISLHPSSTVQSFLNGVHSGYQVGRTTGISGYSSAAFWAGSSSTYVDLALYKPAGYSETEAWAVYADSNLITVVGRGYDSMGVSHALMWTQAVPEPGTMSLLAVGLAALARKRRRSA